MVEEVFSHNSNCNFNLISNSIHFNFNLNNKLLTPNNEGLS